MAGDTKIKGRLVVPPQATIPAGFELKGGQSGGKPPPQGFAMSINKEITNPSTSHCLIVEYEYQGYDHNETENN